MRKKYIFSGMILLALVLTSGTFAYTYPGAAGTTVEAALTDETAIAYEPSADQPEWDDILPQGEYDSDYLLPDAAGSETGLQPSDPTRQNWELVSEMPADDEASYVASRHPQHYGRDLYQLTGHQPNEGDGNILDITVYFRFAGGQRASARAAIKTYGMVFEGSEERPEEGGYTTRSYQWTENPFTRTAWTWDEVNRLQAGVSLRAEPHDRPTACTQVYVAVNFEFVRVQGAVPRGDLYDITPHPDNTGDIMVKVYLTNTSELLKTYKYLNMKLYMANSLEADKTPDYQILSIETGVVIFNIEGGSAEDYVVAVKGGGYRLVSADPYEWGEGWNHRPEFYCEVGQR